MHTHLPYVKTGRLKRSQADVTSVSSRLGLGGRWHGAVLFTSCENVLIDTVLV